MSNSGDLLRMLMPAVRPVPTEGARPGKPPIETLSFDSLLDDASQGESPAGLQTDPTASIDPNTPTKDVKPTEQSATNNALAPLTGIESIQNASLRRIIAEATSN